MSNADDPGGGGGMMQSLGEEEGSDGDGAWASGEDGQREEEMLPDAFSSLRQAVGLGN